MAGRSSSLNNSPMMPLRTTSPTRLRRAGTALAQTRLPQASTAPQPQQRVPQPGLNPTSAPPPQQPTGSVLRPTGQAPPSGRVVPNIGQVGQGPNAGGAQAPVQQGGLGRAGRPGGFAPHSAADALAANPMHFTSGLARTRGWPDIRPKVIGEGPALGAGGALGTALGVPAMQPGTGMAKTPPTNRLGLPNLNTFALTPAPAQTLPVGIVPAQSMNVNIPGASGGGGFGSTGSGLTPEPGTPDQMRDPNYNPGEGWVWNEHLGRWINEQAAQNSAGGGAAPPVDVSPSPEELANRGFDTREEYENAVKQGEQASRGVTDQQAPPPGSDDSFEEWLKRMGDVPQLDQSALEANIRAEDQKQAMEDSRMLQAIAEGGARAGIDASQMVGQQGEIGHRSAVERQTRGAQMRLQANIENFKAQMAGYAQRHQAALQAAEFAQNDQQRADAMAFAEKMLQLQTAAQKEMQKYEWELSKKMAATDWLGLGLGYHMNAKQGARDLFGAFLGGGGGKGAMAACDRHVKKNIRQDGAAVLRALDQLTAYSFEYDQYKIMEDDGRFFGVMAQDLLRSEAGKTIVERDAAGHLYIETKRAIPFLLAVCATLRQEISTLKERVPVE